METIEQQIEQTKYQHEIFDNEMNNKMNANQKQILLSKEASEGLLFKYQSMCDELGIFGLGYIEV